MWVKKIFGENEDLVMSLLNALLPLDEGKRIEKVTYLTPEMVPENPGKKGGVQRLTSVFGGHHSVVDVRCHETGGHVFIMEMQMNWNNEFQQRVILNASKAVVKQLGTSEDYSLLQPVYALNLINDVGFDAGPVWLRFLTEIDRDTVEAPAELLENPDTSKALKILEKSAYDEEDMRAYEYYWDAVYNERGAIRHGYKQGMERGIEDTRRDNARRMKADNMPVELITKYTGLAVDVIDR